MALTDQNFTIKIAKRENIERKKLVSEMKKNINFQRVVLYLAASFSIFIEQFLQF